MNGDKIKTLEAEITSLKETIASTRTEKEFKPGCLGGFFLANGFILLCFGLFFSTNTFSGESMDTAGLLFLVFGALFVVVGIILGLPPKADVLESNKKKVAEVKRNLEEKETELAELK